MQYSNYNVLYSILCVLLSKQLHRQSHSRVIFYAINDLPDRTQGEVDTVWP